MRRILRSTMAYLTIVIIIFALGLCAVKLGDAKTTGEHAAGAEYSILRNALVSIQNKGELSDSLLRNRLLALYRGSDRLLAVQIFDADHNPLWKVPADSQYFALGTDSKSFANFVAPRWSTVVYSTPLSEGMTLTALYTTVRRSDVSEAVRTPLMIVAIWSLLLALAVILLRKEPAPEPSQERAATETNIATIEEPATPNNEQDHPRVPKSRPKVVRTSYVGVLPQVVEEEVEEEEELEQEKEEGETEETNQEGGVEVAEASEASSEGEPEAEPSEAPESETTRTMENAENPENVENAESPEAQEVTSISNVPEPKVDSNRSYEEGYAKLEEEVIEWSNRYQKKSPQVAPDFRTVEPSKKPPVEVQSGPATQPEPTSYETQNHEPPTANTNPLEPQVQIPRPEKPEKHDVRAFPMPLTISDSLLEHKLTEELSRTDVSEELSLLLVHCEVAGPSDPLSTALAATVRDYFGTKDFIFELYRGAFAVILPGLDLGASLKLSEDLADVLSTTMSLYRDIEGEAPVYIGISSCAGRKIDSFKLYREASTAIHKAFSDGNSKILAFRPKTA